MASGIPVPQEMANEKEVKEQEDSEIPQASVVEESISQEKQQEPQKSQIKEDQEKDKNLNEELSKEEKPEGKSEEKSSNWHFWLIIAVLALAVVSMGIYILLR